MATLTASQAPGGHYLRIIERAERDRAHEPAWLRDIRRSAADAFGNAGIPTTRHEEWRFTNVAPIADTAVRAGPAVAVSPREAARFVVPGLAGPVLVFVNGRYTPELSAPGDQVAGLRVSTLADAIERDPEALEPSLARHVERHRPSVRGAEHGALRGRRAHHAWPTIPSPTALSRWCSCRRSRRRRRCPRRGCSWRSAATARRGSLRRSAGSGPPAGSPTPSPRSCWATAPCSITAGSSASPSRRSTSVTRSFSSAGRAARPLTRSRSAG